MSKKNKAVPGNIIKEKSDQQIHLPRHAKKDNKRSIPIVYAVLIAVFTALLAGSVVFVIMTSVKLDNGADNTADNGVKETGHEEVITELSKTKELTVEGKYRFDEVTVYSFDGNGKGSLHTDFNDHLFSYSLTDDTLTIDFEDKSLKDSVYTFFMNKNTLLLKNETRTYELKKENNE